MPRAALLYAAGVAALKDGDGARAALRIEEAIAAASADDPALGRYFRGLCEVYRTLGRYEEAAAAGERAVALAPGDIHAHLNLAPVHRERLSLDEAISCAERAMALDPGAAEAHLQLGLAALLKGDFARGWEEYEWRFGASRPSVRERPHWDGRPLGGRRLLLVADQGFGDVIQFARYIPWAAERCRDIVVYCDPSVASVVAQQPGAGRLWLTGGEPCDADVWAPLSGLPRLAGTRLESIPALVPYVRAEPTRAANWERELARRAPGRRRIGVVWAGNPSHPNDRNRSMTLAALAPLGEAADVALISLQRGAARAQIGDYDRAAPLVDLGDELRDFADTAAVVERLDLLVTVDTSAAHLAGAMGRPVWVLLPYSPDWRWLTERRDSPWYPTARLFRQPAPGRWDLVVAEIAGELHRRPRPAGRA